ncbi:MAG: hypothetical protein JWO43_273 [Candidatus Adlerbacteria bacterium]|nr:hypothetical protein [Candidatus Adlerbacteria bacterium]
METKRTGEVLTVLLFGLLMVLAIVSFIEGRDMRTTVMSEPTQQAAAQSALQILHQVINHSHIYKGVIEMQSECEALSSGIGTAGGNRVNILFTVVPVPNCTDKGAGYSQPFSVAVSVPSDAPVVLNQVMFNGKPVSYNIADAQ